MTKIQSAHAFRRRTPEVPKTHVIACRRCGLGSQPLPAERKGYVIPVGPLHVVEVLAGGMKAYEHERCPPRPYWKDAS